MEEKMYSLHDLAEFTGLTERTLRNYLTQGLLHGEKHDGAWRFTAQQLSALLNHPAVRPGIQAKATSAVHDFLRDEKKPSNRMCTVLDLYASPVDADAIAAFFCDRIHALSADKQIRFSFSRDGEHVRVILTGPDRLVSALLQQFYSR